MYLYYNWEWSYNEKKIVVSAITILAILNSLVIVLIKCNEPQNSPVIPQIILVYAENQVEDYPTTKVLTNLHVL